MPRLIKSHMGSPPIRAPNTNGIR